MDFISEIISGNYYQNNLNVMDLAFMNKQIINKSLKVTNKAYIENIETNSINSKILNVTENNEIILEPEANLKLTTFPNLKFKIKDVFEVLCFMKYLNKICGKNLEKCNLSNLLRNQTNFNFDVNKAYKILEDKIQSFDNITNKIYKNETKINNSTKAKINLEISKEEKSPIKNMTKINKQKILNQINSENKIKNNLRKVDLKKVFP